MGYLHQGHLSLCQKALDDKCDVIAASIFVNPIQFAPNEDLDKYPRNLERDLELLETKNVDVVFAPDTKEMYSKDYKTFVELNGFNNFSEGKSRPGFFRGVATVVTKLFNIVQPTKAYFGQKDFVQTIAIKTFVRDLNIPTEIIVVDTIREEDGLAMSSRNSYLSKQEREDAPIIYKALSIAKDLYISSNGKISSEKISEVVKEVIRSKTKEIDYVTVSSFYDASEFVGDEIVPIEHGLCVSVAAKIGKTRLIDNIVINPLK